MNNYKYIIPILLAAIMLCPMESAAQKSSIGFIYPAGGSLGSSVDIEIGGLNLAQATAVLISGNGVTAQIIPLPKPEPVYKINAKGKRILVKKKKAALNDQSAPQLASRIGVRVTIAPDAQVGLRDLRVQSPSGVSNQLSFEISAYPNFNESQKLNAGEVNELETLPATICGYVKPGEVDRFSFDAKAGMKLVAQVKGRTLVPYIADAVPGWFQPVIRLLNSKGREVAFADDFHTSPDPVMTLDIPYDDKYTLTINDAIFRGRQDFNYRIQIGEIPFAESIFPIIAKVGQTSKIKSSAGINLEETYKEVNPTEKGINYLRFKGTNGELSNPVAYYAVDKDETIITNPNSETKLMQGSVIYDVITKEYEQREYKLPLDKAETVFIDAMARRIDSRADLKITLISPDGIVVMESDDVEDTSQGLMTHHADPSINYKAIQAGDYTLVVEDIHGRAGTDHSYIIRRMKPSAPFEAFVSPANISVAQGGTTTFMLSFNIKTRKNTGGIGKIVVDGLPEGYNVSYAVPGRYAKKWEMSISAPKDAEIGTFPLDVQIYTFPFRGEEQMIETAKATDNMLQAFYYNHYIPAAAFTLEVTPAIPYSVHFDPKIEKDLDKPIIISANDTVVPLKIFIDRSAGFDQEIELALAKKSKVITLPPTKVSAEESHKTIYLNINKEKLNKGKNFRQPIFITASVNGEITKQGKRTFTNALYKEMTPIVFLQKEGMPVVNTYQKALDNIKKTKK